MKKLFLIIGFLSLYVPAGVLANDNNEIQESNATLGDLSFGLLEVGILPAAILANRDLAQQVRLYNISPSDRQQLLIEIKSSLASLELSPGLQKNIPQTRKYKKQLVHLRDFLQKAQNLSYGEFERQLKTLDSALCFMD